MQDDLYVVGVLNRYSNLRDELEGLRNLSELPRRKTRKKPARLIRRVRRPTPADVEMIVETYKSGRTIRDIAKQLGFHRETISRALHDAGVATRYHQTQEVDLDVADQLIARGNTITQTALTMGISRSMLVRARKARRERES